MPRAKSQSVKDTERLQAFLHKEEPLDLELLRSYPLGPTILKHYAALGEARGQIEESEPLTLDDWPEMRPVGYKESGLVPQLTRATRAADQRVRAICEEHATLGVRTGRALTCGPDTCDSSSA